MTSKTLNATIAAWVLGSLMFGQVSKAESIFVDTFDDRDAEDGTPVTWVPQIGTWDASRSDYVASDPSLNISVVPDYALGDTSIRAQVRASGNKAVGVQVRRGLATVGYSGLILPDGTIGFVRADGAPVPTILGESVVPFNALDQDVMLQVDAIGNELSLWAWPVGATMPSNPQVVVSDSTYETGIVGVVSVPPIGEDPSPFPGTFRFVHVADTHIPEPSTLVLALLAAVALSIHFGPRQS